MAGKVEYNKLTFTKEERLKSRKLIELLFSDKIFVQTNSIRIYYKEIKLDCAFQAQFAFAVSKKIFPNATDRNRIKRLMREVVRHQKPFFYQTLKEKNKQAILLISYHAKVLPTIIEIEASIITLFSKIKNSI